MKLYIEGIATVTGEKVIGWLEIVNGHAYVCEKTEAYGIKQTAITKMTKFIGVREATSVFFGEELLN
jgi:hypothetical protein